MKVIARVHTALPEKFGLPRQSGLAEHLKGEIVFELEYRDANALRGLMGFSHIWVLWVFSEALREGWSPTVRPPRLGGNTAMGVFATRSPFRPNPVGLSCVRLEGIREVPGKGPVLEISGIDMMDGTPVIDIKPYLPYADSRPEAEAGFAGPLTQHALRVEIPPELASQFEKDALLGLQEILSQNPRPGYRQNDERAFGLNYAGKNVRFRAADGVCRVEAVEALHQGDPGD